MNNKGQALVEFVMILPIFLFIALGMIDFGNILYQKYQLENHLDNVVDLYKENKNVDINAYVLKHKLEFTNRLDGEFNHLVISKKINITTPGLNLILKNPYQVKVERYIYE
ncbi:MAG: pilus assembly protein [Bacilli bacterium]|nr:pilus assembly protein [Bacilli bacterium]MDD4548016.1 pilus assembly protein [Bacilli bacterium]